MWNEFTYAGIKAAAGAGGATNMLCEKNGMSIPLTVLADEDRIGELAFSIIIHSKSQRVSGAVMNEHNRVSFGPFFSRGIVAEANTVFEPYEFFVEHGIAMIRKKKGKLYSRENANFHDKLCFADGQYMDEFIPWTSKFQTRMERIEQLVDNLKIAHSSPLTVAIEYSPCSECKDRKTKHLLEHINQGEIPDWITADICNGVSEVPDEAIRDCIKAVLVEDFISPFATYVMRNSIGQKLQSHCAWRRR